MIIVILNFTHVKQLYLQLIACSKTLPVDAYNANTIVIVKTYTYYAGVISLIKFGYRTHCHRGSILLFCN